MYRFLLLASICCFAVGCNPPIQKDSDVAENSGDSDFQAQKATTGVGKQGQSLENESGAGKMIAQPAMTLFRFKQKIVFEIQIPDAMNRHRALEGDYPKSHDEFMSKIIKQNLIKLPELPDGQVYHYNTEKSELWVYPADEVPNN